MNSLPFEITHFGVIDSRCWFNSIPKEETTALWEHGMQVISGMGMRWDRPLLPGVFSWNVVEAVKGIYDWTMPDLLVTIAQKYEINLIPVIWPYTAWDQKAWEGTGRKLMGTKTMGVRKVVDDSFPIPPRYDGPHNRESYSKWVTAMIKRYDGDGVDDMPGLKFPIKYYQFINEPYHVGMAYWPTCEPKTFAECAKITYLSIKKGNSECVVVLTGMNINHGKIFFDAIFDLCKKDGQQYYDVIDLHGANRSYAFEVETYIGQVKQLRELLKEYGLNSKIPLWNTKFSTYIGDGGINPRSLQPPFYIPKREEYQSEKDQSLFLVKAACINFVLGVTKVVWGMLGSPEVQPPPLRRLKGGKHFIDRQGRLMLLYYTMKLISEKFDSFKSIKKLDLGYGINAYRYEMGPEWNPTLKQTFVMWNDIGGEVTLTEIPAKSIKVTSTIPETNEDDHAILDEEGNATFKTSVVTVSKGKVKLSLSKIPKIIELS